ncbi:MAG TPA: DUF6622 family protein [Acetobacteraceae bacterium]|jgi:hypothetical protein
MPAIIGFLSHTPVWVFALFGVLMAFGVQALRPRSVSVLRLLVVPAVFITWGTISLGLLVAGAPWLVLDWLAAGAVGALVARQLAPLNTFRFDRNSGRVSLPGSVLPLARNLSIFVVKYALGVAIAVAPAWHAQIASWNVAVSGLSAGYFAAWLLRFARAYRSAGVFPAGVLGEVLPPG